MRIGVFGGSFDPPHAAHAALARAARTQLGLHRILWVPTAVPPHKLAPFAPFMHRLNMVRAVITEDPLSEASGVEASLPQPSYTLGTLNALRNAHGDGHSWFLLLGSDNWAGFPRWHRPGEILKRATPAIFPRPGFPAEHVSQGEALLEFPEMPHQSGMFRDRLLQGGDERETALRELPRPVSAYIREHGLYGGSPA